MSSFWASFRQPFGIIFAVAFALYPFTTAFNVYSSYPNVDWVMLALDIYFWLGMSVVIGIGMGVDVILRLTTDKYGKDFYKKVHLSVLICIALEIIWYIIR